MVDVNLVVLFAVAIVLGLAYGFIGFFAALVKTGEPLDVKKLLATIVYSIIVSIIAVQTGVINLDTISNWQTIFEPVWQMYFGIYLGIMYLFSKVVVPVAQMLAQKTTFFAPSMQVNPARRMDPESRKFLAFDLPQQNQKPTLDCVDQAEAAGVVRYAIESGAWIFLVEFGELTGSKHYFFKGWFGSSEIQWKPITSECLEQIRKTGKFPDYEDLY